MLNYMLGFVVTAGCMANFKPEGVAFELKGLTDPLGFKHLVHSGGRHNRNINQACFQFEGK